MNAFAPRHSRAAVTVLMAACSSIWAQSPDTASTPLQPDFLRANMNLAMDPGTDFFEYANGGWLARNPIPATESQWGIGSLVNEQLYATLRGINEQAAGGQNPAGSDQQKIGDFWITALDTARADRLGVHPLDAELARIDQVHDSRSALDAAFALRPLEVNAFFSVSVSQDEMNSGAMAIHLSQGGLGLPDRDFYFNREPGVARIRQEYLAHIARTLELLGRDAAHARADASRLVAFETGLARESRKLEVLNDPRKNYHRIALAEVTRRYTPSILWVDRLAAWRLHPDYVIVGQPEFFAALERLLRRTPAAVLRDYLRVHLVDAYAATLSKPFDDEQFQFYGRVLSGRQEQRERWKRVLDAENDALGLMLGRIFVQEYFPAATRQRYVELIAAIRGAYRDRIEKLDWMSEATKAQAQLKLSAITAKVGYPDTWKDYSALVIGQDSYCENMQRAARWRFDDEIARYGKPVDRSEWDTTPQTYDAYNDQSNNEIVLPAAIFTIPGVPDALVDDAVAYGYVGAGTIGHEITHAFDDWGRHYDAVGNLRDWWTPDDAQKFQQRAAALVRQFDGYEPLRGLHINGRACLGENIADYGGVLLGLDAFKKTEQYRRGEAIGGLTPVQRYFLGYALGWMSQQREEALRSNLLSDVHAPSKWRVIGPLANVPAFYAAFGIEPGQAMWRPAAQRVQIW